MDLAELQRRIDQHARLDLTPLYEAYRAQSGADDVDGFLAFLGSSRILDTALLKELHGLGDVEVPTIDDPALQGTVLAAWVAGATTLPDPGSGTLPSAAQASRGSRSTAPAAEIRYEPVALLGQGAMGAIRIARDVYLRRKVALKTVLPEMATHPQLLGRFLSEMQITAQLEHPNIVPIYALEVGADGSLGYAMKLVQGQDLAQIIDATRETLDKGQPIDEDHKLEKRLEYFLKVCDALEFGHSKGIVHRDLKPANIMIGRHNEVYLMDWGIARPMGAGGQALESGIELNQADGEQATDLSRTRLGSAIGTPSYMSPEQAAGRNAELDGRSDQYAMGLILQECVSLKRAVGGTTLQEILTKAKEARRDQGVVDGERGHVPVEIEAIVQRATRLSPADRYPSVRALGDDVRRYLRGEAIEAMPDTAARKAGRWISRHRMATLAVLLGLGLAGSTATLGAVLVGQARIAAAHARELRVGELQTESAIEAQLVERELGRYEAALAELVGATQLALGKALPGDSAAYFEADLVDKALAPADFGPSKRHGKDVSVLVPVAALAPGVAREPLDPLLRSLGVLTPALREVMIESSGADPRKLSLLQQRAAITDAGVPAHRVVVALGEGATLTFPAIAGLPAGDARKAPFYALAQGTTGVKWGAVVMNGNLALLPASAALYDDKGAFRGVALLEVALDRLLARPALAKLDYVQSRTLVGRDGKLVAEESRAGGRAPLAPEVVAAMGRGESGSLEAVVDGRAWQYAFYPLATLDWYFVAAGEVRRMLASEAKITSSDPRTVALASSPSAPPPDTSPQPTATALRAAPVDADAGAGVIVDAGADAAEDALADAGAVGGMDPRKRRWPDAGTPAAAPPSAVPTAPVAPPNPFDKWRVYDKKKPGSP